MRYGGRTGSTLRRGRLKIPPFRKMLAYLLGDETDAGVGINGLEQFVSSQSVVFDVGAECLGAAGEEFGLFPGFFLRALVGLALSFEPVDHAVRCRCLRAGVG